MNTYREMTSRVEYSGVGFVLGYSKQKIDIEDGNMISNSINVKCDIWIYMLGILQVG